ncbi:MAG: N-acetyltransferase family protein [Chloroflexaceae bacterium]
MLLPRPYPTHYVSRWTMKDGTEVLIRPIRPDDAPLLVTFHMTLSEHSVYFRYFQIIALRQRIAPARLARICHVDYDRDMVLVVEQQEPLTQMPGILAVGRLSKIDATDTAEFGIVVNDRCHGRGLGKELMQRLIQVGRDEQLRTVMADIHPDNLAMMRICRAMGFRLMHSSSDEQMIRAVFDL